VRLAFPDRIRGVEQEREPIESAARRVAPGLFDWVDDVLPKRARVAGVPVADVRRQRERADQIDTAVVDWSWVVFDTVEERAADPLRIRPIVKPAIRALRGVTRYVTAPDTRRVHVPFVPTFVSCMAYAVATLAENRWGVRDHVLACGYRHPSCEGPHVFLDLRSGKPGPGAQFCTPAHLNRQKQARRDAAGSEE
jgi:hypothetical protein